MMENRQAHWDHVYETKALTELSWYQKNPAISLDLIQATSRLVDALLAQCFCDLTVLDLSPKALAAAKSRLGPKAAKVTWIAADVMRVDPERTYDLWHDRAAFHFLTEAADRQAYAACVLRAVRPGGHVIIGTFAPDGPERCSGLPVMRHDGASIGAVLGNNFVLIESRRQDHKTPAGRTQHFQFSLYRRNA